MKKNLFALRLLFLGAKTMMLVWALRISRKTGWKKMAKNIRNRLDSVLKELKSALKKAKSFWPKEFRKVFDESECEEFRKIAKEVDEY